MSLLLDVLALLVSAVPAAAVVWLGILLATRKRPARTEADSERPTLRRRLIGVLQFVAVLTLVLLSTAVQTAYGAPIGPRSSTVIEVLEVGECSRPAESFGLVVSCELVGYQYQGADDDVVAREHPESVVSDKAIQRGDQVARFAAIRLTQFLHPAFGSTRWRPIEDTGNPDLRWLPLTTLVAGLAIVSWINQRRRSRSGEVDSDEALRGSG